MSEKPSQTKCRDCGYLITWQNQKKQYARAIQKGMSNEAAKQVMPRCQKCLTKYFSDKPNPA